MRTAGCRARYREDPAFPVGKARGNGLKGRVSLFVGSLRREIVNARVWAGLHYRNSGQVGVQLGRAVARYALDHYFQPTRGDNHHDDED